MTLRLIYVVIGTDIRGNWGPFRNACHAATIPKNLVLLPFCYACRGVLVDGSRRPHEHQHRTKQEFFLESTASWTNYRSFQKSGALM